MRLFFGLLVFVPLAIVIGVFAVGNRTPVALHVWPLPGVYEMWASVWVLALLAIGILFGMTVGWLSGSRWRRRARRAEREVQRLEDRLAGETQAAPSLPRRRPDSPTQALPSSGSSPGQAPAARTARFGD